MTRTVTWTRGGRTAVVLALFAAMLCAGTAGASVPLPKPGTPAQVAALVAASSRIQRLPANLLPSLSQVPADSASTYFPVTASGCTGVRQCVFGDTRAASTVVLLGDSHALMWLPSLAPVATAKHLRLVLMWKSACPAASILVWNAAIRAPYTACSSWRAAAIAAVRRLAPSIVLLADRTTGIYDAANVLTTDAHWQAGEAATIAALATKRTRVAVIGDITPFSALLPECLAVYPHRVQTCSQRAPNPKIPGHFAAERAAALSRHAAYLDPAPLLCTSVCSPVIGTMAAYFDSVHVTATYAAYLSGAWSSLLVAAGLVHA